MEHRIWLEPEANRVIKITHPGAYGRTMRFQRGKPGVFPKPESALAFGPATPLEYLDRMALHNELFGRSVRILGAIQKGGMPLIVISQVFLQGRRPTDSEIVDFLGEQGFARVADMHVYFRATDSVALFDAHSGNFVHTGGVPVPFDLIPLRVSGAFEAALDIWSTK